MACSQRDMAAGSDPMAALFDKCAARMAQGRLSPAVQCAACALTRCIAEQATHMYLIKIESCLFGVLSTHPSATDGHMLRECFGVCICVAAPPLKYP